MRGSPEKACTNIITDASYPPHHQTPAIQKASPKGEAFFTAPTWTLKATRPPRALHAVALYVYLCESAHFILVVCALSEVTHVIGTAVGPNLIIRLIGIPQLALFSLSVVVRAHF